MDFKYKEEYQYPTSACLNLTDNCNLACRYCFVVQQPHYMTLDIAKDGVKWLIKNLEWNKAHNLVNDNKKIEITYFGGEPTLMWDEIIVPLTRWGMENYPKQINFGITTNGTLLNEERVKFLAAYDIIPLLSIDGAPETQNYNRPCRNSNLSSADLQYKNIPYILKYFPNTTFRSTIDQHTVSHTFENYIFAQYMGFKNIYMMPNCREKWSNENLKILEEEFKRIYMYMVHCFENDEFPAISFSPINDSFERIQLHNLHILNNTKEEKTLGRCGLGTVGCSIGYDGNIYGCQEQDSKGKESRFYIGNLYGEYKGIDPNLHSNFLSEYVNENTYCGDNPNYCNDCLLTNICELLHCPSSSYDLFNSFNKDSYVHCFWLRTMYEQAITVLKYLDKNKTFRKYLQQYCNYDFLEEGEE